MLDLERHYQLRAPIQYPARVIEPPLLPLRASLFLTRAL